MIEYFNKILYLLKLACREVYGDNLISLVIFGSVARGTPSPESDIDILIVAENIPDGRIKRVQQFNKVESLLENYIEKLRNLKIYTELSPIIKTPSEVKIGSLLFLDMINDAKILYDKNDFFSKYLTELSSNLKKMGAYKVGNNEKWHWVIKPDYKNDEVFHI
ncbi:nucleotidyltransferase domain-containing protein [Thermoanaerobacterium sp. PSU-2]|uniref:nucleotidyltransferase domain-containing protein n=1 Tax=Thermoanaerobacterium sp. PSU-2 TaxID=1930849 RepID=UPI00118075CF|nr:nucleotidyltransferase domain-containing protein [Thermoanaerobacterium sp. PSU-2]